MGRQAHLTRLALGRSPFAEPLRDADGNFIIGPHAHDHESSNYSQQFDDRGHPRNPSSKAAARKLRRAQNDVLAAVGVVVRKDEATKAEWEKLKPGDKHQLIVLENQSGRELKTIDRVTGLFACWCITSYRQRVMTFAFYRDLPISMSLWLDYKIVGIRNLLMAGLPLYLVSTIPQMYRYYIRNPDVEEIVNFVNPAGYPEFASFRWKLLEGCVQSLAFCLEFSLQAFSSLQSLQIIANGTWMPPTSILPSYAASPIWIPLPPTGYSYTSTIHYVWVAAQSPFVIRSVQEYLRMQIGYRVYAMLRQVMIRSDRPDRVSARVSDDVEIIEDTSVPGVGYPRFADDITRLGRSYGPRSFWGAFRKSFPLMYEVLNFMSGGRIAKSGGRLDTALNHQLTTQVRNAYQARHRLCGQTPTSGTMADVALQREITYTTFDSLNLDPEEELVDPYAWTDAALHDIDAILSTPTREDHELFELTEILYADESLEANDAAEISSHVGMGTDIFNEPTSTVMPNNDDVHEEINASTMLSTASNDLQSPDHASNHRDFDGSNHTSEHVEAEDFASTVQPNTEVAQASPLPDAINTNTSERVSADVADAEQPAPVPGISRATSLAPSMPMRARRLTEINQDPEFSFTAMTGFPHQALRLTPVTRQEHRMTLLTTFAVDSFAWHSSAIITTLLLLPIESLYLRSLVKWVVESDPLQPPGSYALHSPMLTTMSGVMKESFRVLGLNEWFGGPASGSIGTGRIAYASTILLTIGLEGLIRGSLWYIGTRRALHRGELFGWGRF